MFRMDKTYHLLELDRVLERLAKVDDVAYIRFASVYQEFQSVEEFVAAIEKLS